jgi:hypothetical protein
MLRAKNPAQVGHLFPGGPFISVFFCSFFFCVSLIVSVSNPFFFFFFFFSAVMNDEDEDRSSPSPPSPSPVPAAAGEWRYDLVYLF